MSLAAKDIPCQYCTKPVGYGDHEKYCGQNPENLARFCGYADCQHPGNVIYDYEWMCRHHADLRGAKDTLKSRKGTLSFAKSSLKRLSEEQEKIRLSIPQMMVDIHKAEEHLEKTQFKTSLAGAPTR